MSHARSSKRQHAEKGAHHDQVELADNFEIAYTCEVRVIEKVLLCL